MVLLVFAGDHGLTEEGVSRYPASVTAAMVATFLSGRASINAFAAAAGVEIQVVDAGVAADLPAHPESHRRQNPARHAQRRARARADAQGSR